MSSFVIAFIETLICDHAATSSGSVYICLYSDHNCLRKFPFVVNTGRTENSFVYFRLLYLLRHRHLSGLYIQSSYVQIYTNTVRAGIGNFRIVNFPILRTLKLILYQFLIFIQ